MYKEAVEKYKNTIGYLNPSYVIQKFLDVQRLENLTDYLETLSRQSRKIFVIGRGEGGTNRRA
jgi:hypothetical protein